MKVRLTNTVPTLSVSLEIWTAVTQRNQHFWCYIFFFFISAGPYLCFPVIHWNRCSDFNQNTQFFLRRDRMRDY